MHIARAKARGVPIFTVGVRHYFAEEFGIEEGTYGEVRQISFEECEVNDASQKKGTLKSREVDQVGFTDIHGTVGIHTLMV